MSHRFAPITMMVHDDPIIDSIDEQSFTSTTNGIQCVSHSETVSEGENVQSFKLRLYRVGYHMILYR